MYYVLFVFAMLTPVLMAVVGLISPQAGRWLSSLPHRPLQQNRGDLGLRPPAHL